MENWPLTVPKQRTFLSLQNEGIHNNLLFLKFYRLLIVPPSENLGGFQSVHNTLPELTLKLSQPFCHSVPVKQNFSVSYTPCPFPHPSLNTWFLLIGYPSSSPHLYRSTFPGNSKFHIWLSSQTISVLAFLMQLEIISFFFLPPNSCSSFLS